MAPRMMPASEIEQLLLTDSRVQDVCVMGVGKEAVAWVVPRRVTRADALEAFLRERLGEASPCVALIDSLPVLESGEPDGEALSRLSPATSSRLQELEARLHEAGHEAVALAGPAPASERFEPFDELFPESLRPGTGGESPLPAARAGSRAAGVETGQPSLLVGEPRRPPPGAPDDLGALLRHVSERHPDRTVTFIDVEGRRETLRFADLWQEALRLVGGLRVLGVKPGERVMFVLDRPGDFVRAFWGCTLGGVVPVPMAWPSSFERSHAGVARILSVSERLGGPLVLTGAQAVQALESLGLRAVAFSALDRSTAGQPVAHTPASPAVLSFTSGSTGRPKGVLLTHDNLLAMCDAMRAGGWYTEEDLGVSWMPLDHVAGLAYPHLTSLRMATSHVLVARDYVLGDVLRWMDLLSEFGGTMSWAPNFAYGLVVDRLSRGERRAWNLSRVRVLGCGGEPIIADTVRRFTSLLAGEGLRQDAVCPAWGMAETSSYHTMTRGVRTPEGEGCVLLGPPPAGSMLRIVDDQDSVVPQGRVGHLQVRGAVVLTGYLEDAEVNARSFTPDGWLRTGDLAIVHDGQMALTGRQKEVLIINGNNVYPQDIEAVVEQVPGVLPSFSVACPTRVGGAQTDELLVGFVSTPDAPPLGVLLRSIREHVGRTLGLQVNHLVPLARHQLPKTELGKRGRTEVRRRFEAGELAAERLEAERYLGGPATLPRCLAVPRWVPRVRRPSETPAASGPLLVLASAGFTGALRANAAGRQVLQVEPGSSEALTRALESLAAQGQHPGDVVYAVGPAADARRLERSTLEEAIAPLLRLVQALARPAAAAPVRLWAVVLSPEGALSAASVHLMVPGLLWSAMAEVSGLEAHVLWVPPGEDAAARCVAGELSGPRVAREVSWHDGQRWERAHVPWVPSPLQSPRRLRREGFYVVTGALGGVGQAWARYLRRSLGARLLLVGRRQRDAIAEALERELGTAEYVPVDLTDSVALQRVLREAESRHGRTLDGAFHFAGTLEARPLESQTAETLVRDAAAHVLGAVALADAFRERPHAPLVFASSLMGTLGAGLHASYCAATGFIDRFAQALAAGGRSAVAVSLSSIRGTGLARDLKASPPGYRMLEPSQALAALLLAVESDNSQVLVGVEGSALPWRLAGLGAGVPLERAHLFVAPRADGQPPADGLRGNAVLHPVSSFPRSSDGTVDRQALAAEAFGGAADSPLGPFEQVVADAFREVLGVESVGAGSDFFSLGGSSLQATRVMARVNERTGLRLREVAVFSHPSVSELAAYLRQSVDPQQLDVSHLSDEQVALLLHALHSS
ncbi:SDR family NAD(P)-dependent oxidoreductase [Archangium lansingense]|uniref:SDR family NAD(P)-dependent oxidoreductase n=1 Tax=Archangium lansingense TaxID=2995310 RepID=A0ABT4A1M2_9BACT|nr:SDR family NAD(P)-dependent oxidoreductase [Archangium lansinium]MCY1075518.1 SDR family NAD(P)-dependent oxidoreductase [Archangium lansinium]